MFISIYLLLCALSNLAHSETNCDEDAILAEFNPAMRATYATAMTHFSGGRLPEALNELSDLLGEVEVHHVNSAVRGYVLYGIGVCQLNLNRFPEAEWALVEAARVFSQCGARSRTRDYCDTYLAMAMAHNGKTVEAVALAESTLLHLGAWGAESDVLAVQFALGVTLRVAGDYGRAIAIFEAIVEETKEVYGNDVLKLPLARGMRKELGQCYEMIGDLKRALVQYDEIVACAPEDRVVTAIVALDRARITAQLGDANGARRLLEDAAATLRDQSPVHYAHCMSGLGGAYMAIRDLDKAERHYRRAHSFFAANYPPGHPLVIAAENNLAVVMMRRGNLRPAKELQLEVLRKIGAASGQLAVFEMEAVENYAAIERAGGNLDLACTYYRKAWELWYRWHAVTAMIGTEREVMQSRRNGEKFVSPYLAALMELRNADAGRAAVEARTLLAAMKGLAFRTLRDRSALLARSDDPVVRVAVSALKRERQGLGEASHGGDLNSSAAAEDAAARFRAAEREVARLVRGDTNVARGDFDLDVRLPRDVAFIDYFAYMKTNLELDEVNAFCYGAVIWRGESAPAVLDLGEMQTISSACMAWYKDLWGTRQSRDAEVACRRSGAAVRELLLDPLQSVIAGCSMVYIAPDVTLHNVPFAALPLDGSDYLVDKYYIAFASTSDGIAAHDRDVATSRGSAVVLGNPNFDNVNGGSARGDDLGGSFRGAVPPLPYSGVELSDVAATLRAAGYGVKVLQGGNATEEALCAVSGPRVLHLATHAYYLPSNDSSGGRNDYASSVRGIAGVRPLSPGGDDAALEDAIIDGGDVMVSTGVLLAGCGDVTQMAALPKNDGVLTAREAMLLDLHGTDLVVVAACNSSLGGWEQGEGFRGLGWAFGIAGARKVVVASGSIPDEATSQLMRLFYDRYVTCLRPEEALARAQREWVLRQRRANGAVHPLDWCLFKLMVNNTY